MIFVLEGLPGSRKTSIIEKIKNSNLVKELVVAPEVLPESTGDPDDFNYYVSNDINKSKFLSSVEQHACLSDRYWHSTIVYYCAANNNTDLGLFLEAYQKIYKTHLFSNYYYIFLDIGSEVSAQKALKHKVKSNWQDIGFVRKTQTLYHMIYQEMEYINPELEGKLYLDMNELGLRQGIKEIESLIHKYHGA